MTATTERPTPGDRLLTEPLTQGEPGKWDGEFAAPPDLGRTVHVVGPVINVKPSDGPHAKNSRGELGPIMQSHYRNRLRPIRSPGPPGRLTTRPTAATSSPRRSIARPRETSMRSASR